MLKGTLPKPFARPSVTVGASATRTWQHIDITEVLVDDIVTDLGKVTSITRGSDGLVLVKFLSGREISSRTTSTVRAFHPVA